ncbi:hypothetical protein LCGC14_0282210 [marine sediment metagenome]|uniref:Uncharacterized protein n=1 Tax=marine sediment metagenome TaxID=412755 RepID=A0A0F9UCD5_9ZZZZ
MRRTLASISSGTSLTPGTKETSRSYQAWVMESQAEGIREAVLNSNLSWPDWIDNAVSRLMSEENEDMVESLITTWPYGRKGKTNISFRVYPSTLERCKALADKYNGTVQSVFGHAFCMESLATGNITDLPLKRA